MCLWWFSFITETIFTPHSGITAKRERFRFTPQWSVCLSPRILKKCRPVRYRKFSQGLCSTTSISGRRSRKSASPSPFAQRAFTRYFINAPIVWLKAVWRVRARSFVVGLAERLGKWTSLASFTQRKGKPNFHTFPIGLSGSVPMYAAR